jgi:signal transduction histidine kinase
VRQLVVRLILAAAAAAVAAVLAAALVAHVLGERSRARDGAEADAAALVSLVEVTTDEEALLRGMARTAAGRDGRLAVHLGGETIGTSRIGPVPAGGPDEVAIDVGTVLLRPVPSTPGAVVEAFVPTDPVGPQVGLAAVLLAAGAVGALLGVVIGVRRVRPVVTDLDALADRAGRIGEDIGEDIGDDEDGPAAPPRRMHVPETAALAGALDALADRFDAARARERRLAADLSHRLRTPLTALALDAGSIGDGPAAERVRQTVDSLNNDVDILIRAPERDAGPVRCDVAAVVRRRVGFWSALAQHGGRPGEFRIEDGAAVIALAEDDLAAVVDALLGNVFRYTPAGAGFAVSVVRHAGWVTLVVDDAGPGVADPVTALSRGGSTSGGTGLGLDIARDAVEATGGTIHVERSALGGARIRLRFGEVGADHEDPHEPRAWRLWGRAQRRAPVGGRAPHRNRVGPSDRPAQGHARTHDDGQGPTA